MVEIMILPLVKVKQNELLLVLFDTKYFATDENGHSYVDAISNFIQTIPKLRHRPTINKSMVLGIANTSPTSEQAGL